MSKARTDWFADETSTGRDRAELRGLSRVTIAARCPAEDDFEWVLKIQQDFLPETKEPKSDAVLGLMDAHPRARDFVLNRICKATIAIIDISEHLRQVVGGVMATIGTQTDGVRRVSEFLRRGVIPQDVARSILRFGRRTTLAKSIVPQVEALMSMAAQQGGAPLIDGPSLFDSEVLDKLSDQEFEQLVGRFSLALADALDPLIQADVIVNKLAGMQYVHDGHVAVAFLEAAVEPDRVFDIGAKRAFDLLEDANDKVVSAIMRWQLNSGQFSPGRLAQDDSRKVLGLQAADIAAGYARALYESKYEDNGLAACGEVRKIFGRVLFNDAWV